MSGDHAIHDFYNRIYKRYDLINRLFTFNNDQRWRNITARECLTVHPSNVLDLCCGTGDLTMSLCKKAERNTEITGCDFNLSMLHIAEAKAKRYKYKNLRFIQGNASNLPFATATFDSITIGFGYRNLTFENSKALIHIDEISRVLKKGGRLLILESGVPENIFIRTLYNIYLRSVLIPLGGLISGDWKAYKYLAYSSANFFNIQQMQQMLATGNLQLSDYRKFLFGAANLAIFTKN